MARPSNENIAATNMIQQFHSWSIRTVINLQTPGEHASCGPRLTSSGFTYEPNLFMKNDIYYYNFAWKDYGEPNLSNILDISKVLAFSLTEGRVAIHCHAGLGRTGVLIACFLVYSLRIRANDAIRLVRKKRPKAVQTSGQILAVQQFEHYLLPQTIVFSSKEPLSLTKDKKSSEFTLKQHLFRQRATLHGVEERVFRYLPKIVYLLCERLLKLCGCKDTIGTDYRLQNRSFIKSFLVYRIKQQHQSLPAINENIDHDLQWPIVKWIDPIEEDIERNLETVSRITMQPRCGNIAAAHIYDAFVIDHNKLPDDRRKYLKQLIFDINQRVAAYERIENETDPRILTGLLFEWLEGLKAPVLNREELSFIIARGHDVHICIKELFQEDLILVEYLLRFVIRLRPLAAARRVDMIRRLIASLTHQTVVVAGTSLPTHRNFQKLRDGTCSHTLNFFLRMLMELQRDMSRPGCDDSDVVMPTKKSKRARRQKYL